MLPSIFLYLYEVHFLYFLKNLIFDITLGNFLFDLRYLTGAS